MKLSDRHSYESLKKGTSGDSKGRLFFNDAGMFDLSSVNILGTSVDTIRQLYHGLPKTELVEWLDNHTMEFIKIRLPLCSRVVAGKHYQKYMSFEFAHSRMPKVSKYRHKLQNNELGIIILFGSWYATMDNQGQHLKIELSPKFISARSPSTIQNILNFIANQVLNDAIPKGCAVHLAFDYQGFDLPENFLDLFSTRSRIIKRYDGLNTLDISSISEAVATYGTNQGEYLIGKATAVQVSAYDKTREIIKSDKVDYFHDYWDSYTFGDWNKDDTVRRLEMRVPHTAIREIGNALDVELESFLQVSEYLTDIWRYALENNRLHIDQKKKILHPFWQFLLEDVEFLMPSRNLKLVRKKKQDVAAIERNVSQILGNIISVAARNPQVTARHVLSGLKKNRLIYQTIVRSYQQRGKLECEIEFFIEEGLKRRRLKGKAA